MKKILFLFLWVIVLQLIAYGMGVITKANLDPWYFSLYKSLLTPPDYVFGIVWGVLYVMIAMAGWQLYQYKKPMSVKELRFAFAAQLVLNWLWSPLFFYFHQTGLALICLIAIVLFTARFLTLAWGRWQILFWLLLPYWLWLCFASYLNFVIWYGNP